VLLQLPTVPLHSLDADGQALFEGKVFRVLRQHRRVPSRVRQTLEVVLARWLHLGWH